MVRGFETKWPGIEIPAQPLRLSLHSQLPLSLRAGGSVGCSDVPTLSSGGEDAAAWLPSQSCMVRINSGRRKYLAGRTEPRAE